MKAIFEKRKRNALLGLILLTAMAVLPVRYQSRAAEMDVTEVEAAEVDVAEVEAAEVDVSEVEAAKVGVTKIGGGETVVPYEVFFVDEEEAGRQIFSSQSGEAALGTELVIRFPERIVGRDGYLWEALSESPKVEPLLQAGTQKYYITFQKKERIVRPDDRDEEGKRRLRQWLRMAKEADGLIMGQGAAGGTGAPDSSVIVEDTMQNNSRIRQLLTALEDSEWHYFYLIGKNYVPQTLVIGTGFEAEYSSEEVERFSAEGDDYTVLKVGARRHWDPETCVHRWEPSGSIPNGCLEQGKETVRCLKCGAEKTVLLPALGHEDRDGDSLCDRCGRRVFSQGVGSRIRAVLHTDEGEVPVGFTCLDEDYRGSGRMLYLSDHTLGPEITGTCFEDGGGYGESAVRRYLRLGFVNDLSIGAALCGGLGPDGSGSSDRAGLLSKEEYEAYEEQITKGQGYFLRTAGDSGEILAVNVSGSVEAVSAGNRNYGVRPIILLQRPELEEKAEPGRWSYGDLQARQIGGRTYLFRCIDEDYRGADDTHRRAALFLCDSVIRADIDSSPDELKLLSFGINNNYKKSDVRSWLSENASDAFFGLEPIYTGVNTAYTGSTGEGTFGQADSSRMRQYAIGFQLLDDRLFCLSVEEALRYRDELWRFGGSSRENPETQISPYSGGYYLRTPVYRKDDTGIFRYSDAVYAVDLNRGNIHAAGTDSTGIGLRPAFALPQG